MIIANGTIEIKAKAVAGIDPATGYPVKPSSVSWSAPIDCQFTANKYNNLGVSGSGEHFTVANYSILIEEQPLGEFEQLRLKDSVSGRCLGEFSVIRVVPLPAVCELQILV